MKWFFNVNLFNRHLYKSLNFTIKVSLSSASEFHDTVFDCVDCVILADSCICARENFASSLSDDD